MNDVVKRALQNASLPSVLEPSGLDIGGRSLPDGITVFPFSGGRSLVWDCTCVDTFAGVHLNRSAMEAGIAANNVEGTQKCNIFNLKFTYLKFEIYTFYYEIYTFYSEFYIF